MPNSENAQDLCILQRMENLYSSAKWHDIEFHIKTCNTGDTVVVGAHRILLATCSPVFEALCFGPLATNKPVPVTDIEPDAFQAMLKFLYTDKLELTSVEMVSSLYYAANKYILNNLLKLTSAYLTENINETNCLDLYNFADIFQDEKLLNESWRYICSHLNFASKYARSDNLSPILLEKLVKAPMLDVKEIVLVQLSQLWAEKTCAVLGLENTGSNIRNLLLRYDIFKNIRFGLLQKDDISLIVPGLLTEDELKDTHGWARCLPRIKPPVKLFYIHRFVDKDISTPAPMEWLDISTLITTNKSVTLEGIYICCTRSLSSLSENSPRYVEKMRLSIEDCSGKVVTEEEEFKKDVQSGVSFLFDLPQPLPILAGFPYDIRIHLLNSPHIYEFVSRNECAKVPSGISIVFKEYVHKQGLFVPAPNLSLVTGLKLSW